MRHTLPDLPYPKNALEPFMSQETLEYHHGKHHRGYVEKLNELIQGTEFEGSSLEEIMRRAKGPIFNNAAQVWNHTFFWHSLSPTRREITGQLREGLDRDFGSTKNFLDTFTKIGTEHFGSGWVWLVRNDVNGRLSIEATPNAENPLQVGKTPLLTCDLWEHAYYIDYRNDRTEFLGGFFILANWDFAEQNLASPWQLAA